MRVRPVIRALAATTLLATCSDPPSGPATPVAGELTLELTAPVSGDGAVLLVVHGPGVLSDVAAATSGVAVHSRAAGDSMRVAIFGRVASGPLLRFRVPDVARAAEYRAAVREVSDATNALQPSLAGYTLRVAP